MSGEFTSIEKKPSTLGVDFTMSNTAKGVRADAVPKNITAVRVDLIVADKRQRKIDPDAVDRLYRDIGQQGLLQPIGVQMSKQGPGSYTVIYGLHRFLAFKRGWAEAQKLLTERTDKDPEAYRMARMWQMIPCVIHNAEMPVDFASLKEIAENLIRSELSKEERAVHETKYTHLVKKLGLVISADEKRSTEQKGKPKKKDERDPQVAGHVQVVTKPTATEKVVADLGISADKLERSHKKVNDLAKTVAKSKGLSAPVKITAESAATPEAEHTLRLAELGAQMKVKAEKEGKDARKVLPTHPSPDNEILVRVDVTDPQQLIDWFKLRLKDVKKPITIGYLRELIVKLDKLVEDAAREALKG